MFAAEIILPEWNYCSVYWLVACNLGGGSWDVEFCFGCWAYQFPLSLFFFWSSITKRHFIEDKGPERGLCSICGGVNDDVRSDISTYCAWQKSNFRADEYYFKSAQVDFGFGSPGTTGAAGTCFTQGTTQDISGHTG